MVSPRIPRLQPWGVVKELLGPPMKAGGRADAVGCACKAALRELDLLEVVDRGEVAVDEAGIGERPEMLGGLQLGRIRRQEVQMDVLGDAQPHAGMPAGAVEDEHDLLGGAGAHRAAKGASSTSKRGVDRRGEVEERAAGGGMDEPDQIAPDEAMLHEGDWVAAHSAPRPDAAGV